MAKINHVALIPDGARRWAKRENVELRASYRQSMNLLTLYVETLFSIGAQVITIYLLSKENLRRSKEELSAVLIEEERLVNDIVPQLCSRIDAAASIAGAVDLLPGPWNRMGERLSGTRSKSGRRLNLCIAYSPLLELWSALRRQPIDEDPETFMSRLWVTEPVDLLIRTGGAHTLSNFIPLQCGYSQLVFLEELFNDTSVEMMLKIVERHEALDVKFGW